MYSLHNRTSYVREKKMVEPKGQIGKSTISQWSQCPISIINRLDC